MHTQKRAIINKKRTKKWKISRNEWRKTSMVLFLCLHPLAFLFAWEKRMFPLLNFSRRVWGEHCFQCLASTPSHGQRTCARGLQRIVPTYSNIGEHTFCCNCLLAWNCVHMMLWCCQNICLVAYKTHSEKMTNYYLEASDTLSFISPEENCPGAVFTIMEMLQRAISKKKTPPNKKNVPFLLSYPRCCGHGLFLETAVRDISNPEKLCL